MSDGDVAEIKGLFSKVGERLHSLAKDPTAIVPEPSPDLARLRAET